MMILERPDFEKHLGTLFGAWNRVLSADAKEGYWKGCELMTLSDFARCVGKAIQTYTEDSTQRLPDVGGIWALKRSLRSVPAVSSEREDSWKGDHWDQKANLHLLAYIQHKPKRYHPDSTMGHVEGAWRAIPGPIGTAITKLLVKHKNQWAQIMREAGRVDAADQKEVWANCMAEAERAIDALSKKTELAELI